MKRGCMAKEADVGTSEFILLGIGGKECQNRKMQPERRRLNVIRQDFIRVLATGISRYKMGEYKRRIFTLQSERRDYDMSKRGSAK